MLNKEKEHHLAVDGKHITQGRSGENLGDVNLWGHEGPPSLAERRKQIDELKMKINSISSNIDDQLKIDVIQQLRSLITDFIQLISELHSKQLERRKKLCNLEKKRNNNQDSKNKYQLPISNIKAYLLRSENLIMRCLAANKSICSVLSNVQLTPYCFSTGDHIILSHQVNVRLLCPVEIVQCVYDTNVYTNLVKQHSELWKHLCADARITGSTVFNALGLHTKKLQDQHFNQFVHKIPPPQFPSDVQQRINYGSENEVNALATLSGIFMPALLPPCSTLYEDCPSFLGSNEAPHLMEVSPDGFITVCSLGSCYQPCTIQHEYLVVEIKCSYPQVNTLPVHYEIPYYYGLQLLAEMKVKNTSKALYCSYSKESTTFILLDFSPTLWHEVWCLIEELYGGMHPQKSK